MRNRIVTAVKQRFSIRKLSIGAASVLLGTSLYFMGGSATIVHADPIVSSQTGNSQKGSANVQNPVDPVEVAREKDGAIKNDDTTVNQAIDDYANQKQTEVGNKVIIRPSGKQPVTVDTPVKREDQVKKIKQKIDDEANAANKDKAAIEDYKNKNKNKEILQGEESEAFKNQGLSVDDEKDSKINQISVDHKINQISVDHKDFTLKDITLLKDQSKKIGDIDGIDVTYTSKMTNKEQKDMKIDSDNKVIIDLQHDQCQGTDITVTYDNLNNSYYLENIDDKTNKIKISKIKRTFSDITPGDTIFKSDGIHDMNPTDGVYDKCDGPQLIIYNDPSDGFFYNNITKVSVKDIYYDDNDNEITFDTKNDKNKAWIFVTSLNSNGTSNVRHNVEKVRAQGLNNSPVNAEKIKGSTVTNTNHIKGWWYSDENNWFNKNPDWDNNTEDNRFGFVGTVAFQYQLGMTLQYWADDSQWGSHWACMQTQIVSSLNQRVIIYDHIKDDTENVTRNDTVTRTIHYLYDNGNTAQPDKTQTVSFNETGTKDDVTGETTWSNDNAQSVDSVNTPSIVGYTPDKSSIEKQSFKFGDQDVEVTVTYHANAQIAKITYIDDTTKNNLDSQAAIGKFGQAITFETAPTDEIDSYEKQGYVLVSNSFNNQTYAADDSNNVFEVHFKHGTTPVDPNHPVDPDNPNNPNNKKDIPGLTHDDLEKKVTRDFTYNFTDGSNHPEAKEDSQTVTFEGHATIDKVTGQLVTVDEQGNITGVGQVQWDKDSKELPNVVAKTVDGYHVVSASNANADGSVDALEVNPNSGSIHVVINYAPNNETVFGKQIVHYVDGDNHNHELMDDSTNSTCVFTKDDKTGKWKEDSYTFSDATAPVIYGYVAEQKTYKGQVATPTDPNKEITIVYHKVGKIVPVGKDGKEIPGAPTPEYKNDPTDPTNVKPNEPIPNVPGYTPVDPSPITPQYPTKPTYVTYTKDPEPTKQGSITVKYHDTTDNVDIPGYGTTDQGNENDPFTYDPTSDLTDLEGKGYVVDGEVPKIPNKFSDIPQTFVINVKHGTITVTPDKPGDPEKPINPNDPDPKSPKYPEGTTKNDLTKDSTQTITYHYSDGSQPDSTRTETINDTFTKTVTVDKVTGKIVSETPWTGSHTFDSSNVPVVNGYHSDKKTVGGKTATVDNPNVTDEVTYTPNGKIVPVDPSGNPIPNVPNPTYPTDPNDPTKVTTDEPVPDVPGMTPETPTVTPADPTKDTPVVYNPIPNVPGPSVGPSDNTPTPVTPTPGKTTEEKKPDENKDDKDVDEPDDDEDVVPTPRHHKKHNGGESSTTRPRPTGYTPAPRGSSYLDANGKVHYKLPQTGESDSEEMAAVLGGAAATIGLIGLAGAKKRRHE